MGQALYRKHRPKSLDDVVGQEHITATLSKALKSSRISHAYLFSGPRGVGKTSIARILAHEVNGLPYTDDSVHLDIIEIDAASNRRIDEIRELRDKVYIAPSSGKYKVYIIDEVHMLTREAFNALLKTLEEPPAHAIFILATTEAHKLPDTIISRTQHYTFKPVSKSQVTTHLTSIAKEEGIQISEEALELIAAHGQGSFRDSISLLDQAGAMGGDIDVNTARQLLGIAPDSAILDILTLISTGGTPGTVLGMLSDLYGQGLRAASIASQLSGKIRNGLLEDNSPMPVDVSLRLLQALIDIPSSHEPERLLEIVLIGAIGVQPSQTATHNSGSAAATVTTATAIANLKNETAAEKSEPVITVELKPDPTSPIKKKEQPEKIKAAPAPTKADSQTAIASVVVTAPKPAVPGDKPLDSNTWSEVLNAIKKQYNTLYGVLRMANPIFTEDSLELEFKFAFHQKRLNEVKNRQIIADFLKEATGRNVTVRCVVNKDATPAGPTPSTATVATPSTALDSINDIFGGGEMLNS